MANSQYVDDPTILDPAELWRRIPPRHFVRDENRNLVRPSSAAFDDHPNGSPMSVLLAEDVIGSGRGPNDVLSNDYGFALASITARLTRDCSQGVARDPLPDEPSHAVVFGNKTDSVRKRLALGSQLVATPPAV